MVDDNGVIEYVCEGGFGSEATNIIHQYAVPIAGGTELNLLWKRIDFGYRSLRINFQQLEKALSDNKNDLINVLRYERYEMLVLAKDYLINREKMRERDIGRLETLAGDYRRSSLRHHVSRGLGVSESMTVYAQGIDERTESLL